MTNNSEITKQERDDAFDEWFKRHFDNHHWMPGPSMSFNAGVQWAMKRMEEEKVAYLPWFTIIALCPDCEKTKWRKGTHLISNGKEVKCPQSVCDYFHNKEIEIERYSGTNLED